MNRKVGFVVSFALAMVISGILAGPASAGHNNLYEVTIVNLTRGQIFSPPLVISHKAGFDLFVPGEPASPELAALAEDGNTAPLVGVIEGDPAVKDYAVAPGPVMPGQSVTVVVKAWGNFRFVSLAGMLVTTNDAFLGAKDVPAYPWGASVLEVPAYDAGSEANNESCMYIPGPPCNHGGVRDTDGAEGYVHIHAGIHGITGDLDPAQHDWRNPVAKIVVRRMK